MFKENSFKMNEEVNNLDSLCSKIQINIKEYDEVHVCIYKSKKEKKQLKVHSKSFLLTPGEESQDSLCALALKAFIEPSKITTNLKKSLYPRMWIRTSEKADLHLSLVLREDELDMVQGTPEWKEETEKRLIESVEMDGSRFFGESVYRQREIAVELELKWNVSYFYGKEKYAGEKSMFRTLPSKMQELIEVMERPWLVKIPEVIKEEEKLEEELNQLKRDNALTKETWPKKLLFHIRNNRTEMLKSTTFTDEEKEKVKDNLRNLHTVITTVTGYFDPIAHDIVEFLFFSSKVPPLLIDIYIFSAIVGSLKRNKSKRRRLS